MTSDIKDLTEGSLWSGILFFSIPLILSNLLQILFNMSDIAVIGRFAGPAALGSVGSTTTLVMMFTGFLMGMGGGVNVLTARFFGQDHIKSFVAGHNDGGGIGIIFQKGDFVFNDAHNEVSGQTVPKTVQPCYSSFSSSDGSLWSFTMLTALFLRSSSMAA